MGKSQQNSAVLGFFSFHFLAVLPVLLPFCLKTLRSCWPGSKNILTSFFHIFGISSWNIIFLSFEAIPVKLWEAAMQSLIWWDSVAWCSAGKGIFNVLGINFSWMRLVCCKGQNPGKSSYWGVIMIEKQYSSVCI